MLRNFRLLLEMKEADSVSIGFLVLIRWTKVLF